MCASFHNL